MQCCVMKCNEMNSKKKPESTIKFRKPNEFKSNELRVPISARIRESYYEVLSEKAAEANTRVASLIEHAVEAYVDWLNQQED